MNTRRRFSCYAQTNPCWARLPTRHHCRRQLACFGLWLVGIWLRRLLRAVGLLRAENLLPTQSSVLRTGLLSAGLPSFPAGILPPVCRRPGFLSAGLSGVRARVLPACCSRGVLPDRSTGARAARSGFLPTRI